MEKKRIDDYEPGPVPSPRPLDRFGFVKQDVNNSSEALTKGRSANEYERFVLFFDRTVFKFFNLDECEMLMFIFPCDVS